MRIFNRPPTNLVVGFLIFVGLLLGGYFVGHTNARSTGPMYITDSSGSNAANVNADGHLSVHIADPFAPASHGPYAPRRLAFFPVKGQPAKGQKAEAVQLSDGQCYVAFVSGPGNVLSMRFQDLGGGDGVPAVLVRLDRSVAWLEDPQQRAASDPVLGSTNGVTAVPGGYVFGFPYILSYKSWAGEEVCWHKPGRSDRFGVELRASGDGSSDVAPDQMLLGMSTANGQTTFSWTLLEGGVPVGYKVYGTASTQATFYTELPITPVITKLNPAGTAKNEVVVTTGNTHEYMATVPAAETANFKRFYIFKEWSSGDPTRIGPIGSWSGL